MACVMSNVNVVSIEDLKLHDFVIVKRKQLLDLLIEVNTKTAVDKRVKWIDKKTVVAKYGVTGYWLKSAENDINSVLKVNYGSGKTSPKKYLEQSIIDEQLRQGLC
jgi:hypothetical protein